MYNCSLYSKRLSLAHIASWLHNRQLLGSHWQSDSTKHCALWFSWCVSLRFYVSLSSGSYARDWQLLFKSQLLMLLLLSDNSFATQVSWPYTAGWNLCCVWTQEKCEIFGQKRWLFWGTMKVNQTRVKTALFLWTDNFIMCPFLAWWTGHHIFHLPLMAPNLLLNNFQNEGNLLVSVPEIGWQTVKRNDKVSENRGRVRLLPVNLGTGVFLWLDGDVKEEAKVLLLAKSLHYGLFAHLAQSIAGSIWNPPRQSVYYSSPIWCSQQKNTIVLRCACPALWPVVCPLLVITAYSRYCMTPHSKV